MKTGWQLPAAIALLACSSCGGIPNGKDDQAVAVPAGAFVAARSGAEFRWRAREMYRNLLMESCSGKPSLRRAVVLAKEAEAVKAFEQRMRSTPAASQLGVALDDITWLQASGPRHCWADEDPVFAKMHVQMARHGVTGGLRLLDTAQRGLGSLGDAKYLTLPRGAEFRSIVKDLVQATNPLCGISADSDDQILAPARAAVTDFRRRLQNTPYALHFAIAEADAEYEASITQVECADYGPDTPTELTAEALRMSREWIARASAIAGI